MSEPTNDPERRLTYAKCGPECSQCSFEKTDAVKAFGTTLEVGSLGGPIDWMDQLGYAGPEVPKQVALDPTYEAELIAKIVTAVKKEILTCLM